MTSKGDWLQDRPLGRSTMHVRPTTSISAHDPAHNPDPTIPQCTSESDHPTPFIDRTSDCSCRATPALGPLAATLGILCALFTGACSDIPVAGDRLSGSTQSGSSRGDRDDIEVSVDAALARAHVAPVAMSEREDGTLIWELRTARDEPGALEVRLLPAPQEGEPVPVEISCRIGRFGDPEVERLIVKSVAHRLEQLRGRDYYRISWN